MWTADDRRSGRAAETAAGRCLDRRFFHSVFSCAALPHRARGHWESLFSTPGARPFNTHPPSSICSNRHMDLWFLFWRVSGKQMRCCWYARSGTVLTASSFFAYNLSTLQVIKVAPTSEQCVIRLTAEGISCRFTSFYRSFSPVKCIFIWNCSQISTFKCSDIFPRCHASSHHKHFMGMKQYVLFLAISSGLSWC